MDETGIYNKGHENLCIYRDVIYITVFLRNKENLIKKAYILIFIFLS